MLGCRKERKQKRKEPLHWKKIRTMCVKVRKIGSFMVYIKNEH